MQAIIPPKAHSQNDHEGQGMYWGVTTASDLVLIFSTQLYVYVILIH